MEHKWFHSMHRVITILLLISIILPFIPLILSSVSSGWRWPDVLPVTFSLRAWNYLFSESAGTWRAIGTSLWIAILVTLINLFLALPAANALARMEFKGRELFKGLLMAPIIIPPFISVMGMHITLIQMGLTETAAGVTLAHIIPSLPYMIRALMVSFQTLGFQWEEQAKMLGAGWIQRFQYVVFPHILPGVVAGASLSILISLSQYLITFLVGGGQVMTLPLLLFPFISGGDPMIGSAYALLFAGIAVCLLWVMDIGLRQYYGKKMQ
jgi:putative spermidine/putrescine transport system permease protein